MVWSRKKKGRKTMVKESTKLHTTTQKKRKTGNCMGRSAIVWEDTIRQIMRKKARKIENDGGRNAGSSKGRRNLACIYINKNWTEP